MGCDDHKMSDLVIFLAHMYVSFMMDNESGRVNSNKHDLEKKNRNCNISSRYLSTLVCASSQASPRAYIGVLSRSTSHENARSAPFEQRATERINLLNTLQEFLNECCAALHSCKIMARKNNSVTSQEGVNLS